MGGEGELGKPFAFCLLAVKFQLDPGLASHLAAAGTDLLWNIGSTGPTSLLDDL